jgi:hypothetical protein
MRLREQAVSSQKFSQSRNIWEYREFSVVVAPRRGRASAERAIRAILSQRMSSQARCKPTCGPAFRKPPSRSVQLIAKVSPSVLQEIRTRPLPVDSAPYFPANENKLRGARLIFPRRESSLSCLPSRAKAEGSASAFAAGQVKRQLRPGLGAHNQDRPHHSRGLPPSFHDQPAPRRRAYR